METLENIVLEIPYLFLKKIPYLWVPIVALWAWPPYISSIFIILLLLGLGLMHFQQYAWEHKIRREHHVIYKDHPQASFAYWGRNLLLLFVSCAILGWLLKGQFGLNTFQWAIMLAGIMATYKDALLFGAGVVYLITDTGIAIRFVPGHIDYRLYFTFSEIRQICRENEISKYQLSWSIIAPARKPKEGILLLPKNLNGFSKQIEEILLTPTDIEAFLGHIPISL